MYVVRCRPVQRGRQFVLHIVRCRPVQRDRQFVMHRLSGGDGKGESQFCLGKAVLLASLAC